MHTYTGHRTNPNDSTHFPPTRNEIDVFSDRGPPFRPLHWPNVLQTLPKPETLSSIEITQKQLIFLGFHVRSTCVETVTSYAKLYNMLILYYSNLISYIYIYIFISIFYRCSYIHTCSMCAMMMLFEVNGWFRFKSPLLWVETPFRPVATGCRGWGPSSRDVGRRKSHQTGGSRCCYFFVRQIL